MQSKRKVNTNFAKRTMSRTLGKRESFLLSKSHRIEKEDERRVERSSYKGLTEDALAYGAEEGRGKLRKATGRSKHLKNRRYPNEGTQRK